MLFSLHCRLIHRNRWISLLKSDENLGRTVLYKNGEFMTNLASKIWHLPESRKDVWMLRIGLTLGVSALGFTLVSQSLLSVTVLFVSALLCLAALWETLRSVVDHFDQRYHSSLSYRVVRITLGTILYCFALVIGAILGLLMSDTKREPAKANLATMPDPSVDKIWESDPTRYYEQRAPNPFDK